MPPRCGTDARRPFPPGTPCPCGRGRAPGAAGLALEDRLDGVAEAPVGSGWRRHRAAKALEVGRGPARRPRSTPALRVAPAVEVDEALEVGEEGRLGGRDGGAAGAPSSAVDRRGPVGGAGMAPSRSSVWRWTRQQTDPSISGRRDRDYPPRTVRVIEIRLLEGPNVYRPVPAVKVEVAVGRRRLPGTAARTPRGCHALVRLAAARSRPRVAGRRRPPRRLVAAPPSEIDEGSAGPWRGPSLRRTQGTGSSPVPGAGRNVPGSIAEAS